MNVGSLFSGIGGFELGFSREGFKTKWFIENNEYCQTILRKNFPNTPIYGDIHEIDFHKLERVDILTGGFPCQDISIANPRGEGISGERSGLWSYYAKAIGAIRPEYAVIENVPMLVNKGLNVVLKDLAKNGYDAEWFCLRASDFGALHRRERLFVIAYPMCMGWGEYRQFRLRERKQHKHFNGAKIEKNIIAHSASTRMERNDGRGLQNIGGRGNRMGTRELERCASSNPNHQRESQLERGKQNIRGRDNNRIENRFITHDWNERIQRFYAESLQGKQGFSWCQDVRRIEDLQGKPNIPEPLFRGGRDGLPAWMDRIKCCGNAVVPQVAQFIARRIKEIGNPPFYRWGEEAMYKRAEELTYKKYT